MSLTTFINPTNLHWENIVFSEKKGAEEKYIYFI